MHPDILMIPNKKLHLKAPPIVEFDTDMLFTLSNNMLRALDHYKAVGLACTQLGLPIRMFVAKVNGQIFTVCNPKISAYSHNISYISKEGCLSVPGYWDTVQRRPTVQLEYQDITGKNQMQILDDYKAAVIQHEAEHLDGILFIDHLSDVAQARARKKVEFWKRKSNLKHKTKRSV